MLLILKSTLGSSACFGCETYLCDGTNTPVKRLRSVCGSTVNQTILASEQPDWADGGGFEMGLSAECQDPAAFEISTSGLV